MNDDYRDFARSVGRRGELDSSSPGAERYRPWVAGAIILTSATAAALYPLGVPACGFMLETTTRCLEPILRLLAVVLTGEIGLLDRSDPRFAGPILRPPLQARQELAVIFCAIVGLKIAGFVGDLLPGCTASKRGYEDGLRLAKLLPWAVALVAVAAWVAS